MTTYSYCKGHHKMLCHTHCHRHSDRAWCKCRPFINKTYETRCRRL